MKKILVLVLVLNSLSAFAGPATNDVQRSISSPNINEHFVQLNSQTKQAKTRQEVKQELEQAQKDGSLKQLNHTIYNGA